MNRFRITILEGVTDAVMIHSSIDPTHRLTGQTDEECLIGRDDVAVMKNYAETPVRLRLTGHVMESGRTVFRPSRQQSFTLFTDRVREIQLGAGESMVMRCEQARDPRSSAGGATVADFA